MSSTKKFLFTSESVSMGHPDKVADQISDAIVDHCIGADPTSRVACETMVTTDLAIVSGEITTKADLSRERVDKIVRDMVREIGYTDPSIGFAAKTVQVHINLHAQSPDISMGVDVGGAGDQGMMFGFACTETKTLMPLPIYLAHRLMENHATLREKGEVKFFRPDAKSQVTVEYNGDGTPNRIHTVVLSTQHDKSAMDSKGLFSNDARQEIIKKLILPTLKSERPDLLKGDLVSVPFNIACGRCRNCKEGRTGICLNVNKSRPGAAYGYVDMGGWVGGQAEYVMVPYADFNLLKFADKAKAMAKIRDLTLLSDIFPTGYHGAVTAGVGPGSTVYVAGAGPVRALPVQFRGLQSLETRTCRTLFAKGLAVWDAAPHGFFSKFRGSVRTDGTVVRMSESEFQALSKR